MRPKPSWQNASPTQSQSAPRRPDERPPSHHLRFSVTAVRASFVLLALLPGYGFLIYGILWFVLPDRAGGESVLDRIVEALRGLAGHASSTAGSDPGVDARGEAGRGDIDGGCPPTRN